MLLSCSGDKSIAFIELGESILVKKIENLNNFVYGIRFI
jgi:hypothetical protein